MRDQLPLFPLGSVLLPGMLLPLRIFEARYRLMMRRRLEDDPAFGVVLTRTGREVADEPEIYGVGTAASLRRVVRYADDRFDIVVQGGRRFRVLDGDWHKSYLTGTVEWIDEPESDIKHDEDLTLLAGQARQLFGAYLDGVEAWAHLRIDRGDFAGDPSSVAYAICSITPLAMSQKQRILEMDTARERLQALTPTLQREVALLLATGVGGSALPRPGAGFSAN